MSDSNSFLLIALDSDSEFGIYSILGNYNSLLAKYYNSNCYIDFLGTTIDKFKVNSFQIVNSVDSP